MQYQQELFAQKTPYLQWLKEQEKRPARQEVSGKRIHRLPFFSCMDSIPDPGGISPDAVCLFVRGGGSLSGQAQAAFLEVFSDGGAAALAYADEDYRGSLEELYGMEESAFGEEVTAQYRFGEAALYRGKPWFKPDFSPDTLASFFYIGSIFAVRGDAVLKAAGKYGDNLSLYGLAYSIFMEALRGQGRVIHIPEVLYTNHDLGDADRLERCTDQIRRMSGGTQTAGVEKVSIVIPSRDNADMLRRCLTTLIKYTCYKNYEILIVDNGSSAGQRECISRFLEELRCGSACPEIAYLYERMDFNFSRMCNIGAGHAGGDYLLFLNDDMEVMDTPEGGRWLDNMLASAVKRHVGAVGAKLYYPGTDKNGCYRIQHAGITNMGIGPAHKLGGMKDAGCMYHGHNTQDYDMLAVTAACMLVRRGVFEECGGFDETFAVAYNDVEFCFRLYGKGYFNVQVNAAALLHHESSSRGQDLSPGRRERLADEKRRLYRKHPALKNNDPFYSPHLVQWRKDAEYNTGFLYGYDRRVRPAAPGREKTHTVFRKYDFRNFLQAKCRAAAKVYDRMTGYCSLMASIDSAGCDEAGDVVIEGWSAVRNADNADIPRRLWLIRETRGPDFRRVYEFDIAPKLREDAAGLLESAGGKNAALSGIHAVIGRDSLDPGTYGIGVFCRDKLICDPEKRVQIRPDTNTDKKV